MTRHSLHTCRCASLTLWSIYRYDFDNSGTINDERELEDLTVNMVMAFKMVVDIDQARAPPIHPSIHPSILHPVYTCKFTLPDIR